MIFDIVQWIFIVCLGVVTVWHYLSMRKQTRRLREINDIIAEVNRDMGWVVIQRDLFAQILLNSTIRSVFKFRVKPDSLNKEVTVVITSAGVIINAPGEEEFAYRNMRDEE